MRNVFSRRISAISFMMRLSLLRVTVRRLLSTSQSSVDPKEMRKFQLLAHRWWDEQGEYSALHSMNDIRVPFIRCGFEDRCFYGYCFSATSVNAENV